MTAAPSMAEVLENHAVAATGLGEWCCKCSPKEWRPLALRHRHVAQSLADAGFGHVASVERERFEVFTDTDGHRSIRPVDWKARAEAAEAQVEAVRALADEWAAYDERRQWTTHLTWGARAIREALDGEQGGE